jgi:hypothetical protein
MDEGALERLDAGTQERRNVEALGAGAEVLTRTRVKNSYSDELKAEALLLVDACAGNVMEASQLSELPYDTLYGWARGKGISPAVLDLKRQLRQPVVDRLGDMQHRILDAMAAKIGGANFQQLSIGLGIVTDKRQVLSGNPDSIGANVSVRVSPEEGLRRLERLVQKDAASDAARDAAPASAAGEGTIIDVEAREEV